MTKAKSEKNVDLIISAIKVNPTISISALSEECQISVKATRVIIDKLKKNGMLKRVGPDKGGHWEIIVSE